MLVARKSKPINSLWMLSLFPVFWTASQGIRVMLIGPETIEPINRVYFLVSARKLFFFSPWERSPDQRPIKNCRWLENSKAGREGICWPPFRLLQNLEDKHYLRIQLEGKVEELWKRFQQALRNYTEATEDRKFAFEALKLRDERSTREIEMQMKKLQKMQVRFLPGGIRTSD